MTARVRERHREAAGKWINDGNACIATARGAGELDVESLAALLAETEAAALERAAKSFDFGWPEVATEIRSLIEADE